MPARRFDLAAHAGLTEAEAARRLAAGGPNELPSAKPRSFLRIVWEVVREPMLLLLVGAGSVNLVMSLREPGRVREAALLFVFVLVVIGITLYQERKTERALDALRDLSSPRAVVLRDGVQRRVPGREVVLGDLLLLAEGERVAADAVILDASNVSVDESLLTGESVPVRKAALPSGAPRTLGRPGGDGTPWLFSGTLLVRGQVVAEVLGTGAATELGRIGAALRTLAPERTRLQREVDRMVRGIATLGVSLAAAVVVLYGLTRGSWLEGLLAGIALAMAMLPEEFPVVLTVFLAIGAWRISKRNVLTRRMPAVELLGAATVLCTDKTGTLTQNRMTVRTLQTPAGRFVADGDALPEPFHRLVEFGILASPIDPFDPMDAAFKAFGARYLARTEHLHADWSLIREYPLSEGLLSLSHVWRSPAGGDYVIAAKGAPEAIVDLCHLDAAGRVAVEADVARLAADGLRVLGVAMASFRAQAPLPAEQHDFAFELLGLVGLHDPVRPDVPEAVRLARTAGLRVVMITGDYPGTALHVGLEAGLDPTAGVVTGAELDAMDEEELARRIGGVGIFARVVPEQKLRIVRALSKRGEVVAMTGDGVNDAPALKAAQIGIAMGQRGTDVAREAAALVLTDDAFSSIVGAVRMGRRIFDNLKKAVAYILAVHVPIAGISLLPALVPRLGGTPLPLVLLPVHIAFLELIIDPTCSVVFEAEVEEAGIMTRPPRVAAEPLFSRRVVVVAVLQGTVVFASVAAVYLWSALSRLPPADVRAITFCTLVVANLGLIFVNRSWTQTVAGARRGRNPALWWVTVGTLACLALLLLVPPARELFQLQVQHLSDLALAAGVGVASVAWFELYKLLRRARR